MHRSTSRRGRWLRFFHRSAAPPADSAELRDALWDLVASCHLNPQAIEDESIRLMVRRSVRLLERGGRSRRGS